MFYLKVWMLGNLARATYVGSSDYMWPYSFNKCDERGRMSQAINACSKVNHYGLDPEVGRGAPEIDVIEAMQGDDEKLPNRKEGVDRRRDRSNESRIDAGWSGCGDTYRAKFALCVR